ncbi:diguanylate cyclase (GGDEF) domain-containing protein [Idiomarina sp. A28L]|uniref:sensor domain-containing diguanylate cyclase n=1 Tax=Idiomarina sp. A28L TaxID=1036674 RepID=UPI0002138BA4|nr:diguanylate cyclase [Idiomarina sp. A28L]EGN75398.1 diguanylate cyclase (GGDEF) domain-containing protein [Idiomarina sp. A28L]
MNIIRGAFFVSLSLLLFLSVGPSSAEESVQPNISYYKAEDINFSLSDARQMAAQSWNYIGTEPPSFGYDTTPHWLKLELDAASYYRLLHIQYPLLDHVDIYFISPQGDVEHHHVGDTKPFYQRPIAADGFVIPVPFHEAHEVLIRVQTSSSLSVPIRIWETSAFHQAQGPRYVSIGLYFGVLLCMVVYNLFGYVVTRETSFFSYSIYVVFTGLLMAALSGVGFRYLWPNWLWLQERAVTLFGGLAFVFATLFITQLLGLRKQSKAWHTGLISLGSFAGVVAICSLFLPYSITIFMLLPFAVIACFYVLILGVAMWIKGMQHAQIFTLAWFFFLVSIIFNALGYLGLIDGQFIQRYAIMIGSGIEVLLLSWVITLMYSAERTEKLGAQEQMLKHAVAAQEAQRVLNEELEIRVKDRTQELQQVSESLQRANATLERKSNEDGLTKLFNRRFFDTQIRNEFKRSRRTGSPLALILLDIDHFKPLNDTHGHQVGDAVLVEFAQRLQSQAIRANDAVCRYGGEEFAIILPATDLAAAELVAKRFLTVISDQPFVNNSSEKAAPLAVTASAGVAVLRDTMDNANDLVEAADLALYAAKDQGRNMLILATE